MHQYFYIHYWWDNLDNSITPHVMPKLIIICSTFYKVSLHTHFVFCPLYTTNSCFHLIFVMASSSFLIWFLAFLFVLGVFKLTESSELEIEELSWLDDDKDEEISMVQSRHDSLRKCDFGSGKWVYDQTYPLYDAATCPYLSTRVTCRKNGRPDSGYEKWRWKPHGCNIPRYVFSHLNYCALLEVEKGVG